MPPATVDRYANSISLNTSAASLGAKSLSLDSVDLLDNPSDEDISSGSDECLDTSDFESASSHDNITSLSESEPDYVDGELSLPKIHSEGEVSDSGVESEDETNNVTHTQQSSQRLL